MKKSEIVQVVNVEEMAEQFELRNLDVKVALVYEPRTIGFDALDYVKSLKRAQQLHVYAKSYKRKISIALKAVELCETLDDFLSIHGMIDESNSTLLALYALRFKVCVNKLLNEATTFKDVHDIWEWLALDVVAEESYAAVQKMTGLLATTELKEVYKLLYSDDEELIFTDGTDSNTLLINAICLATPEQAAMCLQMISDQMWNGEQDTYPIRLMIQKASALFPAQKAAKT